MLPYLVISVVFSYSLSIIQAIQESSGVKHILRCLFNMICEMFLLNYIFGEVGQKVGPLFYLSSLIVVMPAFCTFCLLKNKSLKLIIAMYAMIFFYYDVESVVTATYPYVFLRIACGLLTGMILYYFSSYINQLLMGKKCQIILWYVAIMLLF